MAKLEIVKGATSVLVRIWIANTSSPTGAGLTGLVFNSSGLTCYRARDDDGNAGGTAISLATATLGTWASGGFKEKDATNMPGWYEFGIPNAALATGSRSVSIHFQGAANMAPLPIEIELTGTDNQDGVRGGMTAIPNAAANANGGLPILSSSGTTLAYTVSTLTTYTGNTPQTGDAYAYLGTNLGATGANLSHVSANLTQIKGTSLSAEFSAGWMAAAFSYLLNSEFDITAGTVESGFYPASLTFSGGPAAGKTLNFFDTPTSGDFTGFLATPVLNSPLYVDPTSNYLAYQTGSHWYLTSFLTPGTALANFGSNPNNPSGTWNVNAGGACTVTANFSASISGQNALSVNSSGNAGADLQTIKTQSVTCAAGVTVGAFVGNATHAIAVDSSGDVTFNNTSIATVTTLTNLPSIPANWLTATGINAGALNGKGDWISTNSVVTPVINVQIYGGDSILTNGSGLLIPNGFDANNRPKWKASSAGGTLDLAPAGSLAWDSGTSNWKFNDGSTDYFASNVSSDQTLFGEYVALNGKVAVILDAAGRSEYNTQGRAIQEGVAVGASSSTLTLASTLGHDSLPVNCLLSIIAGTGIGQARSVSAYVDSTGVCTVSPNWTVIPDTTSQYVLSYAVASGGSSIARIE